MLSRYVFYLRPLTKTDIPKILLLQRGVVDNIKDKTHFRQSGEGVFRQCIQQGLTIGLFDMNEKLYGYVMLQQCTDEHKEYIRNLPLEYIESYKLGTLIFKEASLLCKEVRGNYFQALAGALLEEQASEKGYTHICVTFHPDNVASKKNNANLLGYQPFDLIDNYGEANLHRVVAAKKVNKNAYTLIKDKLKATGKSSNLIQVFDDYRKQLKKEVREYGSREGAEF